MVNWKPVLTLTFGGTLQITCPCWTLVFPSAKWGSCTSCPFQRLFYSHWMKRNCQWNHYAAQRTQSFFFFQGLRLGIKILNLHFQCWVAEKCVHLWTGLLIIPVLPQVPFSPHYAMFWTLRATGCFSAYATHTRQFPLLLLFFCQKIPWSFLSGEL